MSEAMTVTLHSVETEPRAGRRHVYLYTVTDQDGHELLTRSADPACDLARELLSRGITGKVRVVDVRGVHRYTVDIEKAAKLTVEDGLRFGPRFRKYIAADVTRFAQDGVEEAA